MSIYCIDDKDVNTDFDNPYNFCYNLSTGSTVKVCSSALFNAVFAAMNGLENEN